MLIHIAFFICQDYLSRSMFMVYKIQNIIVNKPMYLYNYIILRDIEQPVRTTVQIIQLCHKLSDPANFGWTVGANIYNPVTSLLKLPETADPRCYFCS